MPFFQQLVGIGRSAATRSRCGGDPERMKPLSSSSSPAMEEAAANPGGGSMNGGDHHHHHQASGSAEGCFSSLLEHAAGNDVEALEKAVCEDPAAADEIGLWYGRRKGSGQMVLEHRTPLMVAATYGSIDALRFILSLPGVDVNRACGADDTTALHCAACGGSADAVDAIRLLIDAGADLNAEDAAGLRPADVIVVYSRLPGVKAALEELFGISTVAALQHHHSDLFLSTSSRSNSHSPPLSSSPEADESPSSDSTPSPITSHENAQIGGGGGGVVSDKKEYPVDPSLPDIKNSIYSTDEFRMFSFKVRPCSRAYSHDWTECPFVHPGENARRRDPRKYHYSCVPCPDFRKGACRRGDLCEYAHGVFECWLHPAQYRTRLCKDGTDCNRRVCFFAHTNDELRPLFMSTGSAVPSPRSSSMDMTAVMSLLPGSPSSAMSPFTPPMSPSGNGHSPVSWPQPNVPTLHLPGSSNLQSSRLRASLSARDIPADDLLMLQDYDDTAQQLLSELYFSGGGGQAGGCFGSSPATPVRQVRTKSLAAPSNLDDLFSAELSSPRYGSDQGAAMFSPSHKAAILSQFQQHQQNLLSPIKTNAFSKAMDPYQNSGHSPLLQPSLRISSPGRMSPRGGGGVEPISPLSNRAAASVLSQQQLRSLSSRDLFSGELSAATTAAGSPSWSSNAGQWGSSSGVLNWGVNDDELSQLKRISSFAGGGREEPDVSWVHSLVRESPADAKENIMEPGVIGPGSLRSSLSGHPAGSFVSSAAAELESAGGDQPAAIADWLDQMVVR